MDEDRLIAESAEHATRMGRGLKAEQGNRGAEEAGLKARTISDGAMDDSWRNRSGSAIAPGDVQAKEMRANRQAVEARRAVMETGGLTMDDLLDLGMNDGGKVAEEARALRRKVSAVSQHMVQRGAQRIVEDAYMDPNEASMMMEQDAYNVPPQDDGWQVVKKYATLNTGKKIPVFVIEDSLSGMTTGKKYRLAEVAHKIARVLTATGNPDDRRIKLIDATYDQHVQLMREKAQAKQAGNRKRLEIIESKLSEVNSRLGID